MSNVSNDYYVKKENGEYCGKCDSKVEDGTCLCGLTRTADRIPSREVQIVEFAIRKLMEGNSIDQNGADKLRREVDEQFQIYGDSGLNSGEEESE